MPIASNVRGVMVVLAAYAAGAAWFWLDQRPLWAGASQELNTRMLIAFLLPTAAAVLLWSFHVIESRRPVVVREPGDGAATERILFRCVVFICALHVLVLLQLAEAPWIESRSAQLAVLLVGILLVSVGNLLPMTRPNVFVGVRTRRSLRSRRFWMEINRVGGYVTFALGVVVLVAPIVLRDALAGQVIGGAILTAAAILVVQYRRLVRGAR